MNSARGAGPAPASRRPDSFMSPKSSISTPVEDIPGTSRIPNLAGLGSKVASLQQTAQPAAQLRQGQPEIKNVQRGTNVSFSAKQQQKHAAGTQHQVPGQKAASRSRTERSRNFPQPHDEASSSEGEAARQEEDAVVAAGAAAMMSSHALSALDLFVGGSARQVSPMTTTVEHLVFPIPIAWNAFL